ncbi:MAG: LacI family DNA-binding transcriptional regulator [Verrucomicrobia bacterium]|nr:LacI family DNA-binding transcriptional regulator [Verrucomicrobiota bacterium]
MARRNVTLADIAKTAHASIPTVSQVLTGLAREKRVSVRLETKIRKIADRLAYRPNLLARSLRTRRSMMAGVLVNNLRGIFYPEVMAHLQAQLRKKGYLTLTGNHYNDFNLLLEELHQLRERAVDALVLGPIPSPQANLRRLREELGDLPVVAFDWAHPAIDSVLNRAETLGSAAAEYLLQKGVRKVLAVVSADISDLESEPTTSEKRFCGFMRRFGSRAADDVQVWRIQSTGDLLERLRRGLASGRIADYDGFFFSNTTLADFFLVELLRTKPDLLRRVVPVMISGAGPVSQLWRYIAVVYQNPKVLGERLAERLLARMENCKGRTEILDVPPELIEKI